MVLKEKPDSIRLPAENNVVGEIRVKIILVNSADEMAHRRRKLKKSAIRRIEADALVDTGAVRSVIPTHVMEKLGVLSRGQRVAEYAHGRKESVAVTEPIIFEILGRDTLEEALVLVDEVLIGQTVLEKLDLHADCANRRLVPNPAHPDQPVSKVK
jgi:clan AA aspartic protease